MKTWSRREYLRWMMYSGLGLCLAGCRGLGPRAGPAEGDLLPTPDISLYDPATLHEARFYRHLEDRRVQCQVCFRKCIVAPGESGFCRNKVNIGGSYYELVYGRPSALQIDPIEKEPSFHMLPGSSIFGIGTAGCNNRCRHCHNWQLSQRSVDGLHTYDHEPADMVRIILSQGCEGVSFTYNEPTSFYDYMFDVAQLAKEQGLRTIFHTNGSMEAEPLFALLEYMDAVTVDLKAFSPKFYQEVCESELKPVLHALENIHKAQTGDRPSILHLEIVNLIIPGHNDDLHQIRAMCRWIRDHLGDKVPVHFNRFVPAYKLTHLPSTPEETLEAVASAADEEGLKYVYIGNMPGHERNSTFCPSCGKRLIHRKHFKVHSVEIKKGKCPQCGEEVPGLWWESDWPPTRSTFDLHPPYGPNYQHPY
jgi:pyruvate formate lyase activating enzyme